MARRTPASTSPPRRRRRKRSTSAATAATSTCVMNNWNDLQNTPWTYYDYLFRQPVQDVQVNANFSRYTNDEAWELTQQLGSTAVTDPAIQEPLSRLQEIALTEMPAIPMWYNGLWSQVSNDSLDQLAHR